MGPGTVPGPTMCCPLPTGETGQIAVYGVAESIGDLSCGWILAAIGANPGPRQEYSG